jgi:hypothetical protein
MGISIFRSFFGKIGIWNGDLGIVRDNRLVTFCTAKDSTLFGSYKMQETYTYHPLLPHEDITWLTNEELEPYCRPDLLEKYKKHKRRGLLRAYRKVYNAYRNLTAEEIEEVVVLRYLLNPKYEPFK